jgi:hypothetical protein
MARRGRRVEFRIKPAHIEACDAAIPAFLLSPHLLQMNAATAPGSIARWCAV